MTALRSSPPVDDIRNIKETENERRWTFIYWIIIAIASAWVGLYDVNGSGMQWADDDGRYLNNAAMMRDWYMSGEWFHPYEFALRNYSQYPAHSIPYHPPGYAAILGMWFLVFGMSHVSARCFMAACLLLLGISFSSVCRRLGASAMLAFAASLVLITTPEVTRWSRSAMSEIPSLAMITVASYCIVRWIDTCRPGWCWAAFAAAGVAFFSRMSSSGVIPTWFLFLVLTGRGRRIFSRHLIAAAITFLFIGGMWAKFAGSYAQYEVRATPIDRLQKCLDIDNFVSWLEALPSIMGWPVLIVAIAAILIAKWTCRPLTLFFGAWFVCFYSFQVLMALNFEARYFIYIVPAVVGLAASFLTAFSLRRSIQTTGNIATLVIVTWNLSNVTRLNSGVTGYENVASTIAEQTEPGNILVACWGDPDLIFRYRCRANTNREIIRADRVLAHRLPEYAGVPTVDLVANDQDVLDIVRRGRIRFIVTSGSKKADHDDRPSDMQLADRVVRERTQDFRRVERSHINWFVAGDEKSSSFEVCLWQYLGDLPDGPNELSVAIPTAQIEIDPRTQ